VLGKVFILTVFYLLLSLNIFSQKLNTDEKLYLMQLSNRITLNQFNKNLIDSLLYEINIYHDLIIDSNKKEEIKALYYAQYALNMSNGVSDFNPIAQRKKIEIIEECLIRYREHYISGVWADYRYDLLLLRGLVYLYSWAGHYANSLSALNEYEDEIISLKSKSLWQLLDISTVYSGFYENLGLYDEAAELDQLIIDSYKQKGFESSIDSLKYLNSLKELVKYYTEKSNISEVFSLVDEYERFFFKVSYFQKPQYEYVQVLSNLARLSLRYNIKYAKEVIEEGITFLEYNKLDSLTCPVCWSILTSTQLDYYQVLNDWESIYKIISNSTNKSRTHYGLLLEACLRLGKKEESLRIMDFAIDKLFNEFDGLSEFSPRIRAKKIQQITRSRNYQNLRMALFCFSNDSSFIKKYFNYIIRFKSIEVSLNSNYIEGLYVAKSDTLKDLLFNKLTENKSLSEITRISKRELLRKFETVSAGLKFVINDNYPVITSISPNTLAFYSGLNIQDVIVSINGRKTQGKSWGLITKIFNTNKEESLTKIGIKRNGINKVLYFYTKLDSVYLYQDTIISKYAFYTIGINREKEYEFTMYDESLIDSLYDEQYIKYKTTSIPKELLSVFRQSSNLKKFYFSIDGIFNKINIETLTINDIDGATKYLGDLYMINILNSTRDLLTSKENSRNDKSIALFGYPDYTLTENQRTQFSQKVKNDTSVTAFYRSGEGITGNYIFKPLPATKHEVEEIGATLKQKGWDVQIYTGNNALEEQVKAVRSPRVLHIATHGFFAEDIQPNKQTSFMGMDSRVAIENPLLRSGLAFAGAEVTRTDTTGVKLSGVEDGILTAEEAQYLNLDSTELVVLSACETGLGEIVNGEGVYGLQRAFRAAGARSVLMSLWKVDDLATETLMKNFYTHWLDDGMSKHDALWQAKLDLRAITNSKGEYIYAAPFYWGAFVLIGE